jgi:hypothetical protein
MSGVDLLDVSGEDISRLGDKDLRALVVRLCEAELRRASLPISAMTAGGAQDAQDGGIDVRIRLANVSAGLDFIPRANTGFQVKASSMPSAAIKAEMRPKGDLRSSISELGAAQGAYVIISSKDSTTDSLLGDRLKAMRDALADLPQGSGIHVDFYDRERLAVWVRSYAGVALWVRERIGEPTSGWRPYGNWAPGDPPDSEFLLDATGRIYERNAENPMMVVDGIRAIRGILAKQGGVVRLIGLSGLGKTRLVQALFDSRVGADALDPSIVIYTDQGAEPEPSARDMLHRLRISQRRTIVVVDNCNPTTHRALAQMVKESGNVVSLVTVEYDVADDEPEDTEVFRLAPASEAVLVAILERLVPNVSQANRDHIAEFSGGNARVALALAKTIRGNESVGTLNDAELFKRLFYQNQQTDAVLLRTAEVCSLVYSFDGESESGTGAEMPVLAELASVTVKELYRGIGEMRARDLIQKRSKWRAVLPHAIANRLAKQALERIPRQALLNSFQVHERLLKSFARRLGYLHESKAAVEIARDWFSQAQWLANLKQLNDLRMALFMSVAPLCPAIALQAIENAATTEGEPSFLSPDFPRRHKWIWLLRALAYDSELFDRAAFLLARLAARTTERDRDNARSNFDELFHIVLSGTHALVDQRVALARKLLDDEDSSMQELGLSALNAMLENSHFSSSHDFSFGARSRDFGWHPSKEDVASWYRAVLMNLGGLCKKGSQHEERVRVMLARHFRGLWTHTGLHQELSVLASNLAAAGGWPDGWIAVRMTLKYGEKLSTEITAQLRQLEVELRPKDILQKIDAYVLSGAHGHLDIADLDAKDETADAISESWKLANKVAEDLDATSQMTPSCFVKCFQCFFARVRVAKWHLGVAWP